MKKLEQLKKEILNNDIKKFYVFFGEDCGIRKHYTDKISSICGEKSIYETCQKISDKTVGKSLWVVKETMMVFNDFDFLDLDAEHIQKFIDRLTNTCILIYEGDSDTIKALINSELNKSFGDCITEFPLVETKVAEQFVLDEVNISKQQRWQLAINCKSNYNSILLESDKIKNYAQANDMSESSAYESLCKKEQMLVVYDDFNVNLFMDDILLGARSNFAYWYQTALMNLDKFTYSLIYMFNDFLIAHFIAKEGYMGGKKCYEEYELPWGRIKAIRDYRGSIVYNSYQLLQLANQITSYELSYKTHKITKNELLENFFSNII